MKNIFFYLMTSLLTFSSVVGQEHVKYLDISKTESSFRLSNRYMPEFGVHDWRENDFNTENYKRTIDAINEQTPFNFIVPFLRFPNYEIVDEVVHNYVKRVAEYAAQKSVQLAPDLDVRNARRAFQSRYPDELQQMLRLKEIKLSETNTTRTVIPSLDLDDHYSGGDIVNHIALKGSMLRVYSYRKTVEGINSESLQDITHHCEVIDASADSVIVRLPARPANTTYACVMVAFTHLYPDVFAPHLMQFQRDIIDQYKDVPLIGVCRDEWGFPPYYPKFYEAGVHDFWYSEHWANAYTDETDGRNLLTDCLLMAFGEKGKDAERQAVINKYMDMSRIRNTELEDDFYTTVKSVFGKDAVVSVHSTWWPYPDRSEFLKNGLNWWSAKRDWAQTDEVVPYAVRTALCKKWGSPVWYNMYYLRDLALQMWSSALSGGRIVFLPYSSLRNPEVLRAESRIRLLNYISKTPQDCQIAVVFGHSAAANWASSYYEDVGMKLVDNLWLSGYPTDLIPTTEIMNGSLRVDDDGTIWYGKQSYSTVILYNPEFENNPIADFFNKASKGNTALLRIGDWTRDFYGKAISGNELLPETMIVSKNSQDAFMQIVRIMEEKEIRKQTPATALLRDLNYIGPHFKHTSSAPPTTGFSRLIDGTVVLVAGTKLVSGDTIRKSFEVDDYNAYVDAVGVVGVRADKNGNMEALAAGSLMEFKMNDFEIKLKERVDVVLWKSADGSWHGVIQGWQGEIPDELLKITSCWERLDIPKPPPLRSRISDVSMVN